MIGELIRKTVGNLVSKTTNIRIESIERNCSRLNLKNQIGAKDIKIVFLYHEQVQMNYFVIIQLGRIRNQTNNLPIKNPLARLNQT